MRNKNYEFVRRSRYGEVKLLKTSDNLAELILVKREFKNNARYSYELRPELVKIISPPVQKNAPYEKNPYLDFIRCRDG